MATIMLPETIPSAPLESIVLVGELGRRPSRPRDDELQDNAVRRVLRGIAGEPATVLQALSDTIYDTLRCDSAGVSLISDDQTRFYWPAITGLLKPHVGSGTPRHFGPCGDVLQAKRCLHMRRMHERYTYLAEIPHIKEALLAPFYLGGEAVGTVWAIIHEPPHDTASRSRRDVQEYDAEDQRLLEVLSDLAGSAYEIWLRSRRTQAK